jgi:hypothetical protein
MPFLDHYQIVKEQIAMPKPRQHQRHCSNSNPATFIEGGEHSLAKALTATNQSHCRQSKPSTKPQPAGLNTSVEAPPKLNLLEPKLISFKTGPASNLARSQF